MVGAVVTARAGGVSVALWDFYVYSVTIYILCYFSRGGTFFDVLEEFRPGGLTGLVYIYT